MRKRTYTKKNLVNVDMKKSFHFENNPVQEPTLKQTKSVSSLHDYASKQKEELLSNKITQLRSLAQQKDQLMEELTILKQGAVNALMEKQEMIDKLKNGLGVEDMYEDERLQMQKEFNKLKRRIKDLEEDRRELTQKLEVEKNFYFQELYSRDTLIDNLDNRIRELQEQLQVKSEENQILNAKLELRNNQNQELLERLEFKQLSEDEKNEPLEDICHGLTRAKSEAEILSCLYSESRYKIEEKTDNYNEENQEKQRISNLVSYYEQRIQELTEELEKQRCKKYDRQAFQKTLQTEQNEKMDYDTLSIASAQIRKLINLRNDVKDLGTNQKREEENQSQFSMKYFRYDQRMSHHQSINQLQQLNIYQEYQIEEEKSSSLLTSRDLLVGMTGGLLGMGLFTFVNKFVHK